MLDFNIELKGMDNGENLTNDKLKKVLMKSMFKMEELAIDSAPFDQGLLRAGITLFPQILANKYVLVSNAPYSCVLGSREHKVTTINGKKTIGSLKKGDLVLTQAGTFEEVEVINSFNAINKPDYVEIISEYRSDKTHKIKLSLDHKVMSVNKNNCTFWIEAGKLKAGDYIFKTKKHNPNKNKYLVETVECKCKQCNKKFKIRKKDYQNGRGVFCSNECYHLTFNGEGNPNYGNKYSEELKEKLSKSHKKRLKDNPEKHPNRIMSKKGYKTDIEKEVENFILKLGLPYMPQYSISNLFVDFYIPSLNIIIECDGAYWHKNQNKDINRDKKLLKYKPDMKIIHFHFVDKRYSVPIDPNPIKNVYYLQCNPSNDSFVNLDMFEKSKILSIKKLKYKKENKYSNKKYYDIQVKNFHSFICNGLLISNSAMEYGSRPFYAPIQPLKEWARRKLGDENIAYAVQAKIAKVGITASPFFRPALSQVQTYWLPQYMTESFS